MAKKNFLLLSLDDDEAKKVANAVSNVSCRRILDYLAEKNATVSLPYIKSNVTSAWAQYSIRVNNRDELQVKPKEAGIPTAVHYPMPLHLQECFKYLGYKQGDFPVAEDISRHILSLPMNPYLTDREIDYICKHI